MNEDDKKRIVREKNAESHKKIYEYRKNDPEFLEKRAQYAKDYYYKNENYRAIKKLKYENSKLI